MRVKLEKSGGLAALAVAVIAAGVGMLQQPGLEQKVLGIIAVAVGFIIYVYAAGVQQEAIVARLRGGG
ncbi:MAG: hypothetical protein QXU69_08345 [Thermofilaceae archaeon]